MRKSLSILLLTALLGGPAASARATVYEIDSSHTSVQFGVRHLVVSTVRGTLGTVTGEVTIDEANLANSRVEATIDAAGINTRDAKRDDHLRAPDFLDTAKFPTITFRSKKVTAAGKDRWAVVGDLTIKGVTKEVTLDVEGAGTPIQDPFGNVKLGGMARTKIDRQDFGVTWSKTMDNGGLVVGNELDIVIDIELTKKK